MTTPFEDRPLALRTGNYVPLRFEAETKRSSRPARAGS
jgi:hypothetical protein